MLGEILIPPSPNWFLTNAVDSRSEDGVFITASFKSLVVYQMSQEGGLPKILKVIPYGNEKVQLVRLCPLANNSEYSHTVACCSENATVRLINMHTGDVLGLHKEHRDSTISGVAWGRYGEQEVVVTVGSKGRMVVWQARHGTSRVHTITQISELTSVDVNPNDRSQAAVGGEKTILLVELKDGSVLTQLHGHNFEIYCLKWFGGSGNPLSDQEGNEADDYKDHVCSNVEDPGKNSKGAESDNWRSKKPTPTFNGPFIASSDYGRQIFLWDLTAKRYITKIPVPVVTSSFNKKIQGKEKLQGKQHIALTWFNEELVSSTFKGEVLQWKLSAGGARCKVMHHFHTRAIYTINIIGNVVVTCGQDRVIHGFDLTNSEHQFQYPTLGACASTLAFCPHDISRLAIGSQENNIRFVNFESEVPLYVQIVWQNIKGKILSMAWHPEQEGKLLYGTGLGQVGWADMASGRVTTFAYYHQKSVYKVEWAPSVCPERTGFSDAWCAYSFGDRDIVIRTSSDPMADPIHLHTLLEETEEDKPLKDITEFSFSPDYKYLSIGSSDGQVRIFQSSNMQLMVSIIVLRKAIQHLLWQPPTSSNLPYVLAVGSNENKVFIFNLTTQFQGEAVGEVLTQATRELCGHDSRVVWLSWSPHKPEVIASASYDHTVQLWNTNTGEPLVNYGGHVSRVFRVEFSPSDPDLLYSFGEENSIHVWKPSKLTCKTPSESSANLKEYRSKKIKDPVVAEEPTNNEEDSGVVEKKSTTTSAAKEKNSSSNTSLASSKKVGTYRSFFPKLHAVCSRKKSFFHILILNLLGAVSEDEKELQAQEKNEMEEELSDELEESDKKGSKREITLASITETSKKYEFLLEKDSEMAQPEEIAYALQLYGQPLQMDALMTSEIAEQNRRGNSVQADLLHCWQGSLDDHIRTAARNKKLNPFLVSCAPQVSIKLWEFASEAYAEQLVEESDMVTAATYLVNINKVEDAIDLLVKHRFYREAMVIAKCRRGYSEELVNKITMAWAASTMFEGAFDFAAALQVSIGQIEDAARTMARRNDPGSLFITAQLYKHVGQNDLCKSLGLLAIKEVCMKQEHSKIDQFLIYLPDLEWFRTIACCHDKFLKLLQQIKEKSPRGYYLPKTQVIQDKETPVQNKTLDTTEEISSNTEDVQTLPLASNTEDVQMLPLVECVKEEWASQGIAVEQYPSIYESITLNLSTQQMPTSVKKLWFLVSVAVCELIMSPTKELWEGHLTTALNYALSWSKANQLCHLTHALLPRGSSDLSTLTSLKVEDTEGVRLLQQLYHTSELCLLHAHLQSEEVWRSLLNESSQGEKTEVDKNSIKDDVTTMTDNNEGESSKGSGGEVESGKESVSATTEDKEVNTSENDITSNEKLSYVPKTTSELLSALHSHIDFFLRNPDAHVSLAKMSESLSEPKQVLLEISVKLKEKGNLSDEDAMMLLDKANSLKT